MRRILIALIRAYQTTSAALVRARFPLLAWSGCRQWPTCSEYAIRAIAERGPVAGVVDAARRVGRCSSLTAAH